MDRSLFIIFLLLPLLFSLGHAALTFHDIWNLALPRSASPEEAVPDHLPHGELGGSTLPVTGEAGDVVDHSKARVDFGTKAWPYVYYARRDREGTLDWGTKSWPYIFYTKKEDMGDRATSSASAAAAAGNYGRKAGNGFRL